ncbi:hypothetical protein JZM37_19135 [Acinetobacter pittii]|uniref:hypothetical protein n=1 Tax=Acinetobacter pittii TaxID=48296 RepID=UPI00197D7B95|nr:hypothetical protein [Acinetobacter pittii]MBN6526339.1 hypothetical protein [Acinetobacter pittii]
MKLSIIFSILILLNGCSFIDPATFKRSSIAFNNKGGGLSVWNSDLTAAVENRTGQVCMQKALTAKALSKESEVNISDAIVKFAAAIPSTTSPQELIHYQDKLSEALALLTTTTERTAFLESGLFYICQLSINDSLTDEQIFKLTETLIIESAKMDPKTGNFNHVNGPAIANPKPPAK